MNRRPLRSSTEPRQSTDDNPWLLRITYVVVALLFIGCWVLSFNALRQQQQRTAAVAPGGGSANTPTDSLTARLAATSVVDPTGAVAAASAITQATAAPSATARTANSIGTPVAAPAGTYNCHGSPNPRSHGQPVGVSHRRDDLYRGGR